MAGGAESRALVGLGGEWGAVWGRGREEIIQIFKKLEVGVGGLTDIRRAGCGGTRTKALHSAVMLLM